jgi:hypothetical protein
MKKRILPLLLFQLFFSSCEVEKLDSQPEDPEGTLAKGKNNPVGLVFENNTDCAASSADLIAGQNTLVGTVSVSIEGGNYIITYEVFPGYCLSETHLAVVQDPADFPMSPTGNPKNGKFAYSDAHDCVNSYSYEVPVSEGNYIAAHGVVRYGSASVESLGVALPGSVSFCTTSQGEPDMESYFNIEIGASFLEGGQEAWCVDADSFIRNLECYDAAVLSSYGDLTGTSFEKPENFDLVNWVLNQGFVGRPGGGGIPYTFGDVQIAIWELVEDVGCPQCGGLGDASEDRAMEIVQLALANGEGYVPGCGEYMGIILLPENPDPESEDEIQALIMPYELKCGGADTVWADGCPFPGANWATYFYFPYGEVK